MPERIFIGVAWPYANGPLHMGHIAGCYLAADIFARYHRLKGNDVLMVSGSDQHGTPITLRAEQDGVSPQEVVDRYHSEFLQSWDRLGISFDLFTTTGTDNHREVVQDIFLSLQDKGYIYTDTTPLPYCHTCRRFLPDRYVKGTCPHCSNPDGRGDQCDQCGKPLNPEDLIDIRCRISGDAPEIRDSEHFFLKLSSFQEQLLSWVKEQRHWRPNVLNFTQRYLEDGLKDRAISRDLEWGVPLPVPGYDGKRIYVWFEAVIGYLSASKEWAALHGQPDAWEPFWGGDTRGYYFIGKDNIPFHTIIWPAMLAGYGGLDLPYDVPANEFLNLEGRQLSTSRNWAVWVPDYLERFEPDPLRYYISATMPETSDSDFSWRDFVRRNNDELVATFGNLVHRVLTLTHRSFQGRVPQPGELEDASREMLSKAQQAFSAVDDSLHACHFRAALGHAMSLAQEANRYIDQREPWRTARNDPAATANTLWVLLSVINCLKTLLNPFLPFSSEKLHALLGFPGDATGKGWSWDHSLESMPPGQELPAPAPLFSKLDDDVATAELARLGQESA
ncbi:MAG: methionine--tRNA ligase [Chloroflexota bacterium]|nr:methionine--tRNA ligase [Chloroflexota bacterium]MDE2941495.1 methionine--tRNA ligase [Chloroflexota bacterium]MDE3266873.1 methionine--tRNA ligase [Chloroflexota bacterium]